METGLNIKIVLDNKLYEWPGWYFAKKIPTVYDHFGKISGWSLIYFLNYDFLNINRSRKFDPPHL